MAEYVDGFIIAIPKANIDSTARSPPPAGGSGASMARPTTRRCVADDVKGGRGHRRFPAASTLEDDETVVFAWITYESRARSRPASTRR